MKRIVVNFIIAFLNLATISAYSITSLQAVNTEATVLSYKRQYFPLSLDYFKSPPPSSISHYISMSQTELTSQNFYNMGKKLGQNVPSDFWGYVILQFGKPVKENQIYKIQDYGAYYNIPITDIENLVKNYIRGFYENSPSNAFLITIVGHTNEGTNFSSDPLGFGQAMGTMITHISDWINSPPSYSGKAAIMGGIDNELAWNNSTTSLQWKDGYLSRATRPYVYYGSCDSCPYYSRPDWTPQPLGWTLEQVYTMAYYSGVTVPQIYRRDGQNSGQWCYLSLYMFLQGF